MNFANKLTLSRIILTFVFIIFIFLKGFVYKILAFFVFTIASLTDFLDGYIAKKKNQITDFGKLMDPVADKTLIIAAFLAFVEMELIPAWIVVIIIFREFLITGFRIVALTKGVILEAEKIGKRKTFSQIISIYFILFYIILKDGSYNFPFWNESLEYIFKNVIFYAVLLTAILTLVSGVSYLIRNKNAFDKKCKK